MPISKKGGGSESPRIPDFGSKVEGMDIYLFFDASRLA
jgi:hypothetical protein